MERILVELPETFPLPGSPVEHRRGGQRSLPMGSKPAASDKPWVMADAAGNPPADSRESAEKAAEPAGTSVAEAEGEPEGPGPSSDAATLPDAIPAGSGAEGFRAPAACGWSLLRVQESF